MTKEAQANKTACVCFRDDAGAFINMAQVFADPQTQHRQMVVELPHSSGQTVRLVRSPLNFSASPVTHQAPPQLGEHSLQALREELGLSEEQVARGVVSNRPVLNLNFKYFDINLKYIKLQFLN